MKPIDPSKITSVLAYFDVFNYPLTREELQRYGSFENLVELNKRLDILVGQATIFNVSGYYSLQNNQTLIENRIKGNLLAEKYMLKAKKNAKLIAKFPFVKSVMISGSLSKGFMSEDGDIDYFIITQPNRLWVARTLLIAYKKLVLFNSHKYFCVNYFIDDKNLEIEQKNIFTATEIVTLLPMINSDLYLRFREENKWTESFYVNAFSNNESCVNVSRSFFQRVSEPILNTQIGSFLDKQFMRMTLKKWQRKFKTLSDEDFEVAMKSTQRISKHHPNNFQKKVIAAYEERLLALHKTSQELIY